MASIDCITWQEAEKKIRECDCAIIPVGTIEQHGAHAPMGLDNFVATEIATRLADRLPGVLLPTLCYGCVSATYDASEWPGTISLSAGTMIRIYKDIALEVKRQGLKKAIFVNGHLCNTPMLNIAAFESHQASGIAVGILEWWLVAKEEIDKYSNSPGHANELETSLLLATPRAKLVQMEKAVAHPGYGLKEAEWAVWRSGTIFTRKMDKAYVGESGNFGDPRKATVEVGEKVIEKTVAMGLKLAEALTRHVRE